MDRPVLDPARQRVLGALLEKEVTVPAGYPLSLTALRTACNQSTSRDPVTDHSDAQVQDVARDLKDEGLLRLVWAGKGSRTVKYHQLLSEALGLAPDERALLTVLLLRGPQSAGELKTRTDRLHPFADRGDVEACLARLADRPDPLVAQLQRQAGQHDPRWIHLLGPLPQATAPGGPATATRAATGTAGPAIDRDIVLADGAQARDLAVRTAYDTVADSYAEHLGDELVAKPFDRWLLERIAQDATGPIVDVGCGPGHLAAFLADAGADVTGIDLSPAMIARARADYPDLTFEVGDLTRLLKPPRATGWSAVVAWYALVHLAESELPGALAALARTLAPGGRLALAVHLGDEVRHQRRWWDHDVDLRVVLHDAHAVREAVAGAGLRIQEWYVRGPVVAAEGSGGPGGSGGSHVDGPEAEPATERLYVLATRGHGA